MKINFTQLYPEVGASFDRISGLLLVAISNALNELSLEIPKLKEKLKVNNYELIFILSAKNNLIDTQILGPTIRYKAHVVEFTLFLSWQKFDDYMKEVEYVLPRISAGIVSVLERYGVEGNGVSKVFQQILDQIKKTPEKFRSTTTSMQPTEKLSTAMTTGTA